jgi:hypothetical protein
LLQGGVADEPLFVCQNHAVQLLSSCPAGELPRILFGTGSSEPEKEMLFDSRKLDLLSVIQMNLSSNFWRLENTAAHLSQRQLALYPILVRNENLYQQNTCLI